METCSFHLQASQSLASEGFGLNGDMLIKYRWEGQAGGMIAVFYCVEKLFSMPSQRGFLLDEMLDV